MRFWRHDLSHLKGDTPLEIAQIYANSESVSDARKNRGIDKSTSTQFSILSSFNP